MRYKNIQAHEYISIACALVLVCTCALLAAALRPSPALAAAGDLVPAFGSGGIITSNPSSSSIEKANAVAIDASGIYIVGGDGSSPNFKWRIEKRDLTTGALIAGFGTGGVVISDPSTFTDEAYAIVVDASGIYIAGHDYVPGNWQWRIEKRDLTTGALIAGFGTGGVVTSNPTSGLDDVSAIAIDTSGIYVVGRQNSVTSINLWRVEKRDLTTGALIAGFGTGGVVTSDPSTSYDEPYAIAVDASSVYVAGTDSSPGYPDQRWRIEKRDLTTGALIAGFGTGGVVTSDPSTSSDQSRAIAVNASGIYVAGYDGLAQWRVEKRNITTGALIAGFGTGGVVTSNPTSAQGANAVTIDTSNIYIAGYDSVPSRWWEWRIEKRDLTTGALVASFGTGGVVTSDPSTSFDEPYAIAADASSFYVAGKDYSPGNDQWRIEKRESGAVVTPPPTVNLSAAPPTIILGGSSMLTWTSTDATSCAAVSPVGWTSSTATSGSQSVSPATTTTYIISCTGPGGTTQQSTTVTVDTTCGEGNLTWTQTYNSGGTQADYGWSVAVDSGNNIYITGAQQTNGADMFLRKYDSAGTFQWMQTYNSGSSLIDRGFGVDVDSSNNIYVVGYEGTNGNDMFLRKYDSTGAFQWMQTYNSGGIQADYSYGVAVDLGNNIYVAGRQQTNGNDMFLRKYDSTGAFQWRQTYNSGGVQSDYGYGTTVDSGGNIYVTGYQQTNGEDMFLRKYDSSGAFQWMQTYNSGGTQWDEGRGVAVDSSNNIYVIGWQSTNGEDMFLRKYDSTGAFQWMQTYNSGGTQWDEGRGVAIDASDNIYVTGYEDQGANGWDILLRKYDSAGAFQWMQTYNSGGSQSELGTGVAIDSSNNLNVIGYQGTNGNDAVLLQYDGSGCSFTPAPTVTLIANPTTITSGQSSTLTWTSTDAASCAAVSPAGWTAKTTVNDSELVTNITATTTYIIACTGPGGTAQQSTTVTVSGGGGGGCGVQAYDGTATINLSCEDPPVSPLRVQKGAATYGIQLVHENDPNASRIRIQTPSGIKALRKQ